MFEVIVVVQGGGCVYDFKMYDEVVGVAVLEGIKFLADSGFRGILAFHKNSEMPKKKSKYHPLSVTEKVENRRISQERIFVENVIAKFKVFKILSNKYRNRRKRYGLRMSLICGIYNAELRKQ